MKILAALTIALFALAFSACDDSTTPTTPSSNTSTVKFTATLLAANEVPAVTNAEASGSGTMTITFNLTKDSSGAIIGASADFSGTYTGFPNGTALTASHIHTGNAGVAGGVLVNVGLAAGEITFPAGSGTLTKNGIGMTAEQANNIINNPAGFYFNSHTALNPGGVVRGQLVRVP